MTKYKLVSGEELSGWRETAVSPLGNDSFLIHLLSGQIRVIKKIDSVFCTIQSSIPGNNKMTFIMIEIFEIVIFN